MAPASSVHSQHQAEVRGRHDLAAAGDDGEFSTAAALYDVAAFKAEKQLAEPWEISIMGCTSGSGTVPALRR